MAQEKKEVMPLKSIDDCAAWYEKCINEVTPESSSVAQNNARLGSLKGMVGLQRLYMEYERLKVKGVGSIHFVNRFLAHKKD